MHFTRQTFQAFSEQLLALDGLPASAVPSRLMNEGLRGLRVLVPFDAAWWGECSGGIDGLTPRSWLSGGVDLSADFAREWNRIGARDTFALESIRHLDIVSCFRGYDDPEPEVEAFVRRHDLYHAMAITRSLPGSGLLHFIVLYRRRASPRFRPQDEMLFDQFSAHLMQRWSARIAALMGEAARAPGETLGLVDAGGDLVYVGARLAMALHKRFAGWSGTRLPVELARALQPATATLKLGPRRLGVQRCGDLVLLSLAPQRTAAVLPPRELGVALLYAEGRSHKQIARETGLSPATVRTYLREAYLRLGVSDKVALGRALSGRAPGRIRA